jgi:hypothetical protein
MDTFDEKNQSCKISRYCTFKVTVYRRDDKYKRRKIRWASMSPGHSIDGLSIKAPYAQTTFLCPSVKVIVQRKLTWVKSGVNRQVMLQYWGAGHYF